MKDRELNGRTRTDSEWNWINEHRGHYNKQEIRNIIGSERIRVTFSDKIEDSSDKARVDFQNKNSGNSNELKK